jgi:uncharacterized tellurite resistance protein B-like protein
MSFLHFLRIPGHVAVAQPADALTETERRLLAQLEALPPDVAAHVAGFGYILTRVAYADLDVSSAETEAMRDAVAQFGDLSPQLASTVVEIAVSQARRLGGTEDFLVTRRFREISTTEQRDRLLHALFAVASPGDETISFEENNVIREVAEELGYTLPELNVVRRAYADRMTAVQRVRELGQAAGA